MRVILTGGTGFVGRGLSRALLASGHDVVVLTRRDPAPPAEETGLRYVTWDGGTAAGWGALADGAGAVINLAGANLAGRRWTPDYKEVILNSRLAAGRAVAEAIAAARVKPGVVVQASAVGYYGSAGNRPLDETSPPGEGFLAEVVRKWEASTADVEGSGARRVVIRSGLILGRDGGALPRLVRPFKLFAGGPWAGGRQWFSWIHYDDEIAAILFLLANEIVHGSFNLCAPEPLRNRDLARLLGQTLHRPGWWPTPAFALRLALGEMADELLLASQRARPEALLRAGFEFKFPSARAAIEDLVA
jgi:uncharacterized protein (TIGR01777 family)